MMHTSRISYGDQPAMRQSGEVEWPDGMSREVRVRYFDPATGEPCDEKPVPAKPAKKRMEDQAKQGERRERARENHRGCTVIVDGVEHPSLRSAGKVVGCDGSYLRSKLRSGATRVQRPLDQVQAPAPCPRLRRSWSAGSSIRP